MNDFHCLEVEFQNNYRLQNVYCYTVKIIFKMREVLDHMLLSGFVIDIRCTHLFPAVETGQ